ncbi:uncharacterized protein SPSK_08864 [Sporothrix schenckii 1099-18]|uniref:Uncharacterized protein n=1 Tax=Sporothrix schenckii 1099-18 TaxID=1397361 RepID=A0A0F2M3X6_SPOSC|nr:uncharacterized protein SPSK_08864 [Sporothrix schenckii 1099-18]KJR84408.1 hypothetical protein SPSK_08864 [Sporothrix schenckii 1099-18]
MSNNQERSASAVANTISNNAGRAGGDQLTGQRANISGTATPVTTPATATPSPQRPRHHFTRSLSELSSPLRLRRQSQSQIQSQSQNQSQSQIQNHGPASRHNPSSSQGQIQSQTQSRRNTNARDDDSYQDGRGPSSTRTGVASTGSPANGVSPSPNNTPATPSHSPRLAPLSKSRTTSGLGSTLASAAVLTGNFSLAPHDPNASSSNTSSRTGASSTTASPTSSRRPSVQTGKDQYNNHPYDESRNMQSQQAEAHDSARHQRHHHHRHLHNLSTSSTAGYMSSHSTTIAALAAAATAVAAASPTTQTPGMPGTLNHAQPGADTEAADRSQDDMLLQQEKQGPAVSGASRSAPGLPIDPAAVHAAAAALERMQREQSRSAARVLHSAVTDLDGMSTTTSQRLDAAYGSVLSRLSELQDTVLALRSLAAAARATNHRFTVETESITHEIDQQVQQLEGDRTGSVGKDGAPVLTPADQQHRLEQLSERVHRGRQAIQDLAERVETVRDRVQRWERADRAWQERTRSRLKALWVIVLSVMLVLVVLLAIMLGHSGEPAAQEGVDVGAQSEASDAHGKPNFPPGFPDLASMTASTSKFHLTFPNGTTGGRNNGDRDGPVASDANDDPLQRLFEEL